MAAGPPDRPQGRLTLELLVIASGVIALSQAANGVILPAMPKFIASLGGGAFVFGVAISMFSISRLVTNVPAGMLTEKLGRKRVLIGGAAITALFSTLSGTAPNIPVLLFYRCMVGIGSAATITAGTVAMTDLSNVGNRGRSLSLLQAWQLTSGILSPGIGGFLAEYWGLRAPFFASGIGVMLLAAWAAFRLPETRGMGQPKSPASPAARPKGIAVVAGLLRQTDFLLVCLVAFAVFFTRFGASQSLVPLKAYEVLAWTPGQVGLLFTAAAAMNLLFIAPSAFISDRLGRKVAIVPAEAIGAVGLALIAFANTPVLFTAAFFCLNASQAIGGPAPQAYVGDVSSGARRGLSLGVYRTFGDLGGTIGPIVTTFLTGAFSFTAGFLAAAALMLAACLLFGLFARETAGRWARRPAQV